MSKQQEAMRLALDALDCIYSPLHVREINKVSAAMEALRAALADQPQTTHWQGCEEVHPECAAKSWDELEQQYQAGCDHCTHPQYVGIRCNVCGRWTEQP